MPDFRRLSAEVNLGQPATLGAVAQTNQYAGRQFRWVPLSSKNNKPNSSWKIPIPMVFFTKLLDMQGLLDLMSIEKLSAWGLVKLWKPLATRPCMHFLVNVAFNAVGQSSTSTHLAMVWGSIHALQTDPAHNWPTETPDKKPDTSQSVSFDSRIAGNDSGSLWRYNKPWGFFSYVQTPFGFSD